MYKAKVYILIYLSMMLPVLLSAAPIDKYYVPQQQQHQQQQPQRQQMQPQQQGPSYTAKTAKPDIHTDFRNKVKSLSDIQKKELKVLLEEKMNNAANDDDKKYYEALIEILN